MRRLFLLAALLLVLAVTAEAQLWNAARQASVAKIAETVFDNGGAPWPFFSTINGINYDQGGSGVAYNSPVSPSCPTNGSSYRSDYINFNPSTDGPPFQLGCNAPGTWHKYTTNFSQIGPYVINLRAASADTSGSPNWTFLVDGVSIGVVPAVNTGSYTAFTTIQSPQFNASLGNHIIEILASGPGCCAGDISSFVGGNPSINTGATPAAAAAAGFTQHALHMDFTDPFFGNQANWLADCGANPTAAGPGAHGFLWRGWVGFGPGSKAQCSDFTQQTDPIDGKLSLRMIINNNELVNNSCTFLKPPICPLGLIETTDVDGNCHTNGAYCANFYYNEIVLRIEDPSNSDGIYDFWTVQCPETDGQESTPPGSNSQGNIATSHVDLCSNIGSNPNGFYSINPNNTLDMSQYYKMAWRLNSSGGAFANAGCGGGGGDGTHVGMAGYVTQNVTQDPVKLNTDPGVVCVPTQALIDGTNDGHGNPGGADNGMGSGGGGGGIQLDNVTRDFQLNTGGPTRVIWIRSVDGWVHPNWSPTNQRPANAFSPSQQPNP